MNYKYVAFGVGAGLVAFGSRLLFDHQAISWPVVVLAAIMIFGGQSIVRYEDFPHGKEKSEQLMAWLSQKKADIVHKVWHPNTQPSPE